MCGIAASAGTLCGIAAPAGTICCIAAPEGAICGIAAQDGGSISIGGTRVTVTACDISFSPYAGITGGTGNSITRSHIHDYGFLLSDLGGVYIAGGVTAKLAPRLAASEKLKAAYLGKGPSAELYSACPLYVVTTEGDDLAMEGAFRYAAKCGLDGR